MAGRGVPRLLLVEPGTTPPASIDVQEDWIRIPADERDLWARLQRLTLRHRALRDRPRLHDGGVLRYRERTLALPEGEAQVAELLLADFGHLVLWDDLAAALWPDGDGSPRRATERVARLRRRLTGVGLAVHTIRGRGVVLDHGDGPHTDDTHEANATHDIAPDPGAEATEDDTWPSW